MTLHVLVEHRENGGAKVVGVFSNHAAAKAFGNRYPLNLSKVVGLRCYLAELDAPTVYGDQEQLGEPVDANWIGP